MAEQMLMKDGLGDAALERIASALAHALPGVARKRFTRQALEGLTELELKERVHHLIAVLHLHLPKEFPEAAAVLVRMRENWDSGDLDDPLAGFAAWPLIDYISTHGLDHPETSLDTLEALSGMFTGEFAIRPFIVKHWNLVEPRLHAWCMHDDVAVRRLVSEGTRPRLPWGMQLKSFVQDPAPILPLLEKLRADPNEMVRRSVANNLNDISKDHPELVIQTGKRWLAENTPNAAWTVRHACRTLIKSGHPAAFPLLGFTENPKIDISDFAVTPNSISLGEAVTISFNVNSRTKRPQRLAVDYAVHHQKANGTQTAKVFKLRETHLGDTSTVSILKDHRMKLITTRKYYAGDHAIEIFINGRSYGRRDFKLII